MRLISSTMLNSLKCLKFRSTRKSTSNQLNNLDRRNCLRKEWLTSRSSRPSCRMFTRTSRLRLRVWRPLRPSIWLSWRISFKARRRWLQFLLWWIMLGRVSGWVLVRRSWTISQVWMSIRKKITWTEATKQVFSLVWAPLSPNFQNKKLKKLRFLAGFWALLRSGNWIMKDYYLTREIINPN